MSKILVVDTEPRWLSFCQECGLDTSEEILPGYGLLILSSRMMSLTYSTNLPVIIATLQPITREAIVAYRHKNVVDYIAKDLRKDTLLKAISRVVEFDK